MSFFGELRRRKVFRVAAGYLLSAWVLIQVVETIFPAFGFDDAAFRMLVIVLAIGLVPAVILSWAFELTRGGLVPERSAQSAASSTDAAPSVGASAPTVMSVLRRPRFAIPLTAAALLAIGTIAALWLQLAGSRAARQDLVPQIERLLDAGNTDQAYALALEAEDHLPDDPLLARLWSELAARMSFVTEPAGADVFYRRYSDVDGEWLALGKTPVENVRLPRDALHWRFEKEGYETAERAVEAFDGTYRIELTAGELADDRVRIPETTRGFLLTGYPLSEYDVPTFTSDRMETSNAEFAEFVRDGGYESAEYWSDIEFVHDGEHLSWSDAVDRFRDRTGRLAPATWEGGTYPEGGENLPVTGISWFEAAAYARYRGKQLPTIYHWSTMTVFPSWLEITLDIDTRPGTGLFRSELAAHSNFSHRGPVAVGSLGGVSPFGAFDTAGNVREWCWNATGDAPDAERYILGGSSQDPNYLYSYGIAKSPWDRSPANGVRLVDYDEAATTGLQASVALPAKETLTPVSDEVFGVYRELYDYDRTPLNATVDATDTSGSYWTRETVSFDATYNDERMLAHIFLPKNIEPPYQVIMYFSSSAAILRRSSDELEIDFIDFIIKSGRAVVLPILWGTYERNTDLDSTWPNETREYSNNVVRWIQDFRRTVDYLETRDDMDLDKLGFYGFSWGGWNGPIVLALDERFETGVFLSGGIPPTLARPEASSASYASRVTQPVLMISGKNDVLRPVATYQAPMFESLGTAPELKRHAILDGGHVPPRPQIVRETLHWFDRYLGPVE
jgi:formylglycine-generating enzyme required for sulfatase activity